MAAGPCGSTPPTARPASPDDLAVTSGELRWRYPQHLRVQPGSRTPGRAAVATQIQLVCGGPDGSYPALVFAGGDVTDIRDADRLANAIRHAIARFRVDNADRLGLTTPQARMLSRLLIGPEFLNHEGGEGETVSLLGALPVPRPAPATAEPAGPSTEPAAASSERAGASAERAGASAERAGASAHPSHAAELPHAAEPVPAGFSYAAEPVARHAAEPADTVRLSVHRPGLAADEARALQAAAAEEAVHQEHPDLASRAAELAARVADLVSAAEEVDRSDEPTRDLAARAERVRRTAARFAANSGKGKTPVRRPEREPGTAPHTHRR